MSTWTYRGKAVIVPRTADIPYELRQGNAFGWLVQRVLDQLEPWKPGEDPIETNPRLPQAIRALVVPNAGLSPFWAVHRGHKARNPAASPFVRVYDRPLTRAVTIELTGTPDKPKLVRAYPGEYTPPQPWMNSAGDADGGKEACIKFWLEHSYVFRDTLIRRTEPNPPTWFLENR